MLQLLPMAPIGSNMRQVLIKVHLYAASFFLPALLLMALSGGLYLNGFKGTVETSPVEVANPAPLDPKSLNLKQDIDGLLQSNGIVHHFEYVKISGKTLITRPTSRDYYSIDTSSEVPVITLNKPDLVKQLVELHKGHGPGLFKTLQKVMAVGLVIILLSGFWLGVSSEALRAPTLITTIAGLVIAVATTLL
ncbi:MAG: hypothetical protein JJ957_12150 [Pseudomonadales bacterium]|nr:hypothetical protein [Pseudomonadales bacterium]MBO6596939.1 hypothetical protein [Pseudomonadales bacterium]MBO6823072.1 hypothetical protein [Pseudomonadales bacterium]